MFSSEMFRNDRAVSCISVLLLCLALYKIGKASLVHLRLLPNQLLSRFFDASLESIEHGYNG